MPISISSLILVCVLLGLTRALTAEWKQLSDSASLPMSQRYRTDLREKLSRINVNALSAEDRTRVERLLRMLGDSGDESSIPSDQSNRSVRYAIIGVVLLVVATVWRFRKPTPPEVPTQDDIRSLRLSKYE